MRGRVTLKFELNGGVDFGERRGVRVTFNPTVALTLGSDAREDDIEFELNGGVEFGGHIVLFLGINKKKVLFFLHIQILFRCHFRKTHLPLGLVVHNFPANFVQKYDF